MRRKENCAQGTRSPTAKSKMAARVWKGVYAEIFWHSRQLSLSKSFDLNTPSMRKVADREKTGGRKIKSEIVATNIIASQLPEL